MVQMARECSLVLAWHDGASYPSQFSLNSVSLSLSLSVPLSLFVSLSLSLSLSLSVFLSLSLSLSGSLSERRCGYGCCYSVIVYHWLISHSDSCFTLSLPLPGFSLLSVVLSPS